mmetsp:Transcript_56391/g.155721  ORF Transcript_56391/g.155721 Transcript_56391/m.155721 type:complete len:215 (+) Transcript_56391:443-1087(+)
MQIDRSAPAPTSARTTSCWLICAAIKSSVAPSSLAWSALAPAPTRKGLIEHCTPHTRPWRTRRNSNRGPANKRPQPQVHAAAAAAGHQRSLGAYVLACSRAHQRPHHLEVADLRRDEERRGTTVLRLVHARARAHQRPHHLEVAILRRDKERRGTIVPRLVHARGRAPQKGFIEHCTPHTRPWRTRRNLRNPRQGRWPRRTNRKRTRPRACSGC